MIFCMLTPIAYAAVVAPLRNECGVHAKPSGGVNLDVPKDELHRARKGVSWPAS
jgi:hypothetical protein